MTTGNTAPKPPLTEKQKQTRGIIGLIVVVLIIIGRAFMPKSSTSSPSSTSNDPNAAATATAKSDCEIAWSIEKGGPSTYGVSHSDYITACVRATP